MSKRKKQLEEFFSSYESHFNNAINNSSNVEEDLTASFAECFVESNPAGVMCGQNNSDFAGKIKEGFEFYKSIGTKEMNIISKDITLLDDFHSLVKVLWRYAYSKDEKEGNIDFTTFYLLNTTNGETKIFAYIAGDEQKNLRDRGLVPQTEETVSH
ncbi:MAG TPA: hypothetical protein VK666_21585 [Chryseolinea sp.]|nr:hypothetical protein [Chryseolinea sp.]